MFFVGDVTKGVGLCLIGPQSSGVKPNPKRQFFVVFFKIKTRRKLAIGFFRVLGWFSSVCGLDVMI